MENQNKDVGSVQRTEVMTHPELVQALCKDGRTILSQMTSRDAHLIHMALGISGEAGELLDAIKKSVIYLRPLDIPNIIEELGDLEFYMEGLRERLNITREQVLQDNINKLTIRYGKMYSDKSANERNDKQ